MRYLLIIVFLPFYSNLFSQELKTDNNLTGNYTNSTSTQIRLNFIGINSLNIKSNTIEIPTNYSLKISNKLDENEFTQRINISHNLKTKFDIFSSYQYNYSLIRNINGDHWIGIGISYKNTIKNTKLSISYATIYDRTIYNDSRVETEIIRHSLKLKSSIEKSIFGFSFEYFYQPNFKNMSDYIIYGTSKIVILPKNSINLIFQDVLNYQSRSDVKLIHNLSIGFGYKFSKNFDKPK